MIGSTLVLAYLMWMSDSLTPEFFHFVTCLSDTQGHILWVFMLWACFKLGFTSKGGLRRANQNSVFAAIELVMALVINREGNLGTISLFVTLIIVFNIR